MVASRLVTLEDPVALSAFKAGQDKYTKVSTGAPSMERVEGMLKAPLMRTHQSQDSIRSNEHARQLAGAQHAVGRIAVAS